MPGSETPGSVAVMAAPAVAGAGPVVKITAVVALVLASLAVGLGLSEVLVRFVAPQLLYRYPQGLFVNDPEIGYRLAPGFHGQMHTAEYSTTIRIDRDGLRDDREVASKRPGVRRILVVGDSFAMGHSVEQAETFEQVIAQRLETAAGRPVVEMLNSGVPGYSTRDEIAYLRSRGLALEPDVVLLAFFVGNDVVDNANTHRHYQVVDGYLTDGNLVSGVLPVVLRSFLARNSDLYHLLWPIQRRLRGEPVAPGDPLAIYVNPPDEKLWAPTRALLGDLVGTARGRGLPVVVVVIPDMVQVDSGLWNRVARGRADVDRALPDRLLVSVAQVLSVPVLDLLPALAEVRTHERLYFPIDHHWTVAGNRVAAETMAPFLAAR